MTNPHELIDALERCGSADEEQCLRAVADHSFSLELINRETWNTVLNFLSANAYHDAAMALVPEGWRVVSLFEHEDGFEILFEKNTALSPGNAATLPLAIAAASIKARVGGE